MAGGEGVQTCSYKANVRHQEPTRSDRKNVFSHKPHQVSCIALQESQNETTDKKSGSKRKFLCILASDNSITRGVPSFH